MATDIAFALGVLTLLGPRIPFALKVFLLALAVVDDIGAIAVIAVFYAEDVAFGPLLLAGGLLVAFAVCVRLGVRWPVVYLALGLVCWLAVLESGVHATVAGVLLALLVPASPKRAIDDTAVEPALAEVREPPLDRLERRLHPWVSYGVVPLFAFASAGVELSGSALGDAVRSPVAAGVAAGLVAGKPVGILLFAWLAVRARVAHLPRGVTWRQLSGAAVLAGIGFTVSLFVTGLAFRDAALATDAKLGILAASLVAGVAGYAWLRVAHPLAPTREP
jgi:NhaA family Na+:H+ antiporter